MTDNPAAGNPASTIPEEAVSKGAAALKEAWITRYQSNPQYAENVAWDVLTAARPHLLAAEVSAHRAEQDAVHADLSQLLRVLGMGDHARPQSSHEVMLDAISEVGRLRRFADDIRAEERERIVAELQQEAATHLFTIRRTMRWAVWVVRGKPESDDPSRDYLVRPEAADERPVCCPAETEAVRRAVAGRDSALARVRALGSAAILIGGERYVRADYVREALEADRD